MKTKTRRVLIGASAAGLMFAAWPADAHAAETVPTGDLRVDRAELRAEIQATGATDADIDAAIALIQSGQVPIENRVEVGSATTAGLSVTPEVPASLNSAPYHDWPWWIPYGALPCAERTNQVWVRASTWANIPQPVGDVQLFSTTQFLDYWTNCVSLVRATPIESFSHEVTTWGSVYHPSWEGIDYHNSGFRLWPNFKFGGGNVFGSFHSNMQSSWYIAPTVFPGDTAKQQITVDLYGDNVFCYEMLPRGGANCQSV